MNKKYFIQDWGTYSNDTLVFVAVPLKEIIGILGHYNNCKKFKEAIIKESENLEDTIKNCPAFIYRNEGFSFLWLKTWKRDMTHYYRLMHEVHHLIFFILGDHRKINECEAQAYQFEYLFRHISEKLNKLK